MKKSKKLLIALLIAALAVSVVAAFTACGEEEEPPANTKSYQLVGEFTGELASYGMEYSFMLNLNVDNTAVLSRYNMASYNHDPAATNKAYEAEMMTGTWKATLDADGVDSLQIKIGADTAKETYYAYQTGSEWEVRNITFPLAPGFSRTVTLKGGETKKYADGDAMIAATKRIFAAPASIATFADTENNGTVYVQDDGKLLVYSGYSNVAEGQWGKDDSGVYVVIDDKAIDVTIEGTKATFAYTYVLQGDYKTEFSFVLDDFTKLPAKEKPAVAGETYTCKIAIQGSEVDAKLSIVDETKCSITVSGFKFDYTYTKDGNTISLTYAGDELQDAEKFIFGKLADRYTLNAADGTMTAVTD